MRHMAAPFAFATRMMAILITTLAATAAAPPDPIVIIVHKTAAVDSLSTKQLKEIFFGGKTRWPNGQPIQTLSTSPDTQEHAAAIQFLFGMTEAEYEKYVLQANFTGKGAEVPRDAGSAQAVVNLVGLIPGAISFARVSLVNGRVKVIRIDGLAPGDKGYPLGGVKTAVGAKTEPGGK